MTEMRQKGSDEMFCPSCGNVIKTAAEICPHCGVRNKSELKEKEKNSTSQSRWTMTLLLAIFLGTVGAHRFYVGKTGTAILMILTIGGCGIWTVIDILTIATGNFRDKQGNLITNK